MTTDEHIKQLSDRVDTLARENFRLKKAQADASKYIAQNVPLSIDKYISYLQKAVASYEEFLDQANKDREAMRARVGELEEALKKEPEMHQYVFPQTSIVQTDEESTIIDEVAPNTAIEEHDLSETQEEKAVYASEQL